MARPFVHCRYYEIPVAAGATEYRQFRGHMNRIIASVSFRSVAAALWLAIFAGALAGCASSPRAQTVPEVHVSTLRLLPQTDGQRSFGVTLLVRNPNIEPVDVRTVEFSIRLGPGGFLRGRIDEPTTVPALDEVRVRTTVSGEFVTSTANLMSFLRGPESALPYEIEGTIWLDLRPPRDLRFEREGAVPLAMSAAP